MPDAETAPPSPTRVQRLAERTAELRRVRAVVAISTTIALAASLGLWLLLGMLLVLGMMPPPSAVAPVAWTVAAAIGVAAIGLLGVRGWATRRERIARRRAEVPAGPARWGHRVVMVLGMVAVVASALLPPPWRWGAIGAGLLAYSTAAVGMRWREPGLGNAWWIGLAITWPLLAWLGGGGFEIDGWFVAASMPALILALLEVRRVRVGRAHPERVPTLLASPLGRVTQPHRKAELWVAAQRWDQVERLESYLLRQANNSRAAHGAWARAERLHAVGDREAATRWAERALLLDPRHTGAWLRLADNAVDAGADDAAEVVRMALRAAFRGLDAQPRFETLQAWLDDHRRQVAR